MSKKVYTVLKCDVCNKEKPKSELLKIKVKDPNVLQYSKLRRHWAVPTQKLDICTDCLSDFKRWKDYIKEREIHQ